MDASIIWYLWCSLHGIAKVSAKFYPLAFMFVRTETTLLMPAFSPCARTVVLRFSGAIWRFNTGHWITLMLLCMRFARSVAQFDALSELVVANRSAIVETEYTQWFEEEDLAELWDIWFCSASDTPGVVPSQNPIEPHHHTIKATAVNAAIGHVLAGTLPKVLGKCAMDVGSEWIRQYAPGPMVAEILLVAVDLCADSNHYPRHKNKSRNFINRTGGYFFNSNYCVAREDNLHGLNRNEHGENVRLRYLSLHVVRVLNRTPFEHDWSSLPLNIEEISSIRPKFKCDCKAC
ncbi:Hypothetical protein PHPALM_36992 [Phytophthora palmivora]|uniref:Uncharacterized protein n=1 Tax=Phytophthora palmivora TaxID=4796 RepID=A0A2P4WYJ5_9STRA|nr:Hypothetical protein PHPALM_36992 [Phytophthora palmivora]